MPSIEVLTVSRDVGIVYFGKSYVLGSDKDLRIHTTQNWLICLGETVYEYEAVLFHQIHGFPLFMEQYFSKFLVWNRTLWDCKIIEFATAVDDSVTSC